MANAILSLINTLLGKSRRFPPFWGRGSCRPAGSEGPSRSNTEAPLTQPALLPTAPFLERATGRGWRRPSLRGQGPLPCLWQSITCSPGLGHSHLGMAEPSNRGKKQAFFPESGH